MVKRLINKKFKNAPSVLYISANWFIRLNPFAEMYKVEGAFELTKSV
jgi:hypothetical protein